jgi:hypothetical protein
MPFIRRLIGNAHRKISDESGDQIQAGMEGFGKYAQAARGQRQENLQAHQQNGGADRGNRRHLLFPDRCGHIHTVKIRALA